MVIPKDSPPKTVALAAEDATDLAGIASDYQLPIATTASKAYDFLLVKTKDHWELRDTHGLLKPWRVDFMTPALQQRAKQASPKTEVIAKAIGIKQGQHPRVLDVTAGIGRDSFILACLGCQVVMLECSSVLAILLQDALVSMKALPLTLHHTKAQDYLQTCERNAFDVIYMDPMFPKANKSALVKKEMQILQAIVGADHDSEELLLLALNTGVPRIVVKRPKSAPPVANRAPSHHVLSKDYRFDVYTANKP